MQGRAAAPSLIIPPRPSSLDRPSHGAGGTAFRTPTIDSIGASVRLPFHSLVVCLVVSPSSSPSPSRSMFGLVRLEANAASELKVSTYYCQLWQVYTSVYINTKCSPSCKCKHGMPRAVQRQRSIRLSASIFPTVSWPPSYR